MKTSLDYKKLFKVGVFYIAKYRVVITIFVLVGVFGFAVFRINELSDPQPNEAYLAEAITVYKPVKIDEQTVEDIRKLIESNVEVEPQFNNRDNPFSE